MHAPQPSHEYAGEQCQRRPAEAHATRRRVPCNMRRVSDTKHKLNPQVPAFGPLPMAVIGCGRMGKLHCRFYSQMPQVKLVGVYDSNPDAAADAAAEYNTKAFASLDDL